MKYFVVIISLFLPNKSYEVYHILLTLPMVFYLFLNRRTKVDLYVALMILGLGLIWLFSLARSFYFDLYAVRDYLEVVRFLPLLFLMMINPIFDAKVLTKIFLSYVTVDFVVSVSQFAMMDVFSVFTHLYGSAYHLDTSLLLNNRATGLSTGPGQHGTIMTFFYLYFLYLYLFDLKVSRLAMIGAVLSITSMLLSQSQTSFIVSMLMTGWMILYALWNGNHRSKLKSIKLALVGSIAGTAIFITFFHQLRYLLSLFTLGLERNSFQRRIGKVDVVQEAIHQFPEMLLLGFGNSFFGRFARAMDNEYLYIFSIYGAPVGGVMIFFILLFIATTFYKGRKYSSGYLLVAFILTSGLIFAYPSVFFTETRILFLIGVLFYIDFQDKQKVEGDLQH